MRLHNGFAYGAIGVLDETTASPGGKRIRTATAEDASNKRKKLKGGNEVNIDCVEVDDTSIKPSISELLQHSRENPHMITE